MQDEQGRKNPGGFGMRRECAPAGMPARAGDYGVSVKSTPVWLAVAMLTPSSDLAV